MPGAKGVTKGIGKKLPSNMQPGTRPPPTNPGKPGGMGRDSRGRFFRRGEQKAAQQEQEQEPEPTPWGGGGAPPGRTTAPGGLTTTPGFMGPAYPCNAPGMRCI